MASTWIMAPLTSVFVRTNSLLEALKTTPKTRVLAVMCSDPQAKFPLRHTKKRSEVEVSRLSSYLTLCLRIVSVSIWYI